MLMIMIMWKWHYNPVNVSVHTMSDPCSTDSLHVAAARQQTYILCQYSRDSPLINYSPPDITRLSQETLSYTLVHAAEWAIGINLTEMLIKIWTCQNKNKNPQSALNASPLRFVMNFRKLQAKTQRLYSIFSTPITTNWVSVGWCQCTKCPTPIIQQQIDDKTEVQ